MLGDGRGGFRVLSGPESGIAIYGEQRAVAISDYDHDGRLDAVISQNGSKTKLLHNVRGKPGLRLKLQGSSGNPTAVGATVRLFSGSLLGPAQEIRAGSGYWSQDSSTLVMTSAQSPTAAWVRWPGGKTTESILPPGAISVSIETDGTIKPAD